MKKSYFSLITILFAFVSIGFLTSCTEKSETEKAVEEVEEAVEEAGEAVKEAAEEVKETAEQG